MIDEQTARDRMATIDPRKTYTCQPRDVAEVPAPYDRITTPCLLQGPTWPTARVLWTDVHGDPGHLHVLHHCDRGAERCVNLEHMYLGTSQDNAQDREDRNRGGHAYRDQRFTYHETVLIHKLLLEGFTVRQVSMAFEVNSTRVSHIKRTGPLPPSAHAKLTNDQVLEIRRRYAAGDRRATAMAREFGVTKSVISAVGNGYAYDRV